MNNPTTTTTFRVGSGVSVEMAVPVNTREQPIINSVEVVRPHDRATVDAEIPNDEECYLLVEMETDTYRLPVQDGVNEYTITDGEVQEE